MLSYSADYAIGGLNERGYHITSIIFHVLAGLALFWLLNILFKNSFLSFFTSALFLVHPVNVGAVTYISGRADPMAVFFMMLALCANMPILVGNEVNYARALYCAGDTFD